MRVTEIPLAGHHGRQTISLPDDAQILSIQWMPERYGAALWVLAPGGGPSKAVMVEMVHTWHTMPPGRYKHIGSVMDHNKQMCHYFLVSD